MCTMLYRAVFIKNMKFNKKVHGVFEISEIPKKSFPRNPEKFSRHFPKFPDFPEIPGFSWNAGIFQIFGNFLKLCIHVYTNMFVLQTQRHTYV